MTATVGSDTLSTIVLERSPVLLALLFLLSVLLLLWGWGNGIPYSYDGIEIYFTYLIGWNAATFSHVNPLMADIAASPAPAAHPYYYTHHPNLFAHLLTQLLVRSGVQDLRWHTVAALLIAFAGVSIGAVLIRQFAGELWAAIYVTISALHYVGVLTWAPVMLRSLHFGFFWISIALLHRYLVMPSPWRLASIAAVTYLVFLNDYTLAPFILVAQLVLVVLDTRSWRRTTVFVAVTSAATAASIATWLGVLVVQFGWHVVLQDIRYTSIARNVAQFLDSPPTMVEFYHRHRIVFWNVLLDSTDVTGLIRSSWGNALALGHGGIGLLVYGVILGALLSAVRGWLGLPGVTPGLLALGIPQLIAAGVLVVLAGPDAARAVRRSFRLARHAIGPVPSVAVIIVLALGVLWSARRAGRLLFRIVSDHVPRSTLAVVFPNILLVSALGVAFLASARVSREWPELPGPYLVFGAISIGVVAVMRVATLRIRRGGDDICVWILGATLVVAAFSLYCDWALRRVAWTGASSHITPVIARVTAAGGVVLLFGVAVAVRERCRLTVRCVPILARLWPLWVAFCSAIVLVALDLGVIADAATKVAADRLSAAHFLSSVTSAPTATVAGVALGAALVLLSRRFQALLAGRANPLRRLCVDDRGPGITPHRFVVAGAVAALVMTCVSIGPFTMFFVHGYKPALVFVEDFVLAALVLAGGQCLASVNPLSYRHALVVFAVFATGFFWVSHQAALLVRYPPSELAVAHVLRRDAFQGKSFVEEAMYAAVWYYTRGTAHSVPPLAANATDLDFDTLMFFNDREAKADLYRRPEYFACVRQHVQGDLACLRWVNGLRRVGHQPVEGVNMLFDDDFMIYRFGDSLPKSLAEDR